MATDSTRTDPTPRDRIEQAYRFVERMREPDIVTPDEERRLRHLFSLIEAAARAEGRQQAVREAKEQLRPPPHLIGYSVVCEVLDRVAGLNASESPRKPGCIYKHPHPEHECRNQDDMRGDASESPPPEYGWHNDGDECIGPHCINMEHDDERDASESGQPPEASEHEQRVRGLSHAPGSMPDCSPLLCGHRAPTGTEASDE